MISSCHRSKMPAMVPGTWCSERSVPTALHSLKEKDLDIAPQMCILLRWRCTRPSSHAACTQFFKGRLQQNGTTTTSKGGV
ncbi:hypothetical protein Tco_1269893 [Tanacetum coccineum]